MLGFLLNRVECCLRGIRAILLIWNLMLSFGIFTRHRVFPIACVSRQQRPKRRRSAPMRPHSHVRFCSDATVTLLLCSRSERLGFLKFNRDDPRKLFDRIGQTQFFNLFRLGQSFFRPIAVLVIIAQQPAHRGKLVGQAFAHPLVCHKTRR